MSEQSLGPLVLDIAGVELQAEDREILRHPQVGGVILFSRNYESPQQLQGLLREIREQRAQLVVAVDHEGGRVQRFREGFTPIPAMQQLGNAYRVNPQESLRWADDIGWLLAAELLAFDIDISFAPVLDINYQRSEIIGDRAFSANADEVISLSRAFIQGMHGAGMASTGKHFPGHGGVAEDSHLELPVDRRDYQSIKTHDMRPFAELGDVLDAVMPAHIIFPDVDDQPVGFSARWLKQVLREELAYRGIIFSDDLSMEGAAGIGDFARRASLALAAGCDAVLVCNNRSGAAAALEGLERQGDGPGPGRLAAMKHRAKLGDQPLARHPRWRAARDAVERLSAV